MLSPSSYVILDSKVTVITGGSRGIGKAIADALISNGGKVAIGDLLEEEGQAVVKAYNEK
jgi:3alpha(or 20beta)-hydroxysteroid dehydrogenase